MSVKIVMDRLVANRGKFVDEVGRELKTARFFATHQCERGHKLVLLANEPGSKIRELVLSPDGQVVLKPTSLGELPIRRNGVMAAAHSYNRLGNGKLSDIWVL